MIESELLGDMLFILGTQSKSERPEELVQLLESYEIAVEQEKTAARYGDVQRFFQEQADLADTFARQVELASIALKRTLRRNVGAACRSGLSEIRDSLIRRLRPERRGSFGQTRLRSSSDGRKRDARGDSVLPLYQDCGGLANRRLHWLLR